MIQVPDAVLASLFAHVTVKARAPTTAIFIFHQAYGATVLFEVKILVSLHGSSRLRKFSPPALRRHLSTLAANIPCTVGYVPICLGHVYRLGSETRR